MDTATVKLPWGAWYADGVEQLTLPEGFRVDVLEPAGGETLPPEAIERALASPVGSPRLDEIVRAGQTICIAVDDLTRPTNVVDVLRPLLRTLEQAGIPDTAIKFVIATGSHAALSPTEVSLKLGDEISRRFRVISHDCRDHLAGTGITYGDHELRINAAFLNADVRIVISSVLPHSFAGNSGGAKMVIPGLSGLESIRRSHKMVQLGRKVSTDPNENIFRSEAEELVRRIGVHFTVCMVSRASRETIGVAAGGIVEAHRAACRMGDVAFRTPLTRDYHIALLNAYPKDGDLIQADTAFIPLKGLSRPLVMPGGLYILSTAAWLGVGEHGIFGPQAMSKAPGPLRVLKDTELWTYVPRMRAEDVRNVYCENYACIANPDALRQALTRRFPQGAHVAVLPCAPMQQFDDQRI